ncbi:hypothetical protein ABZ923_28455 [Streptomyces sp. NPDC046881]|uniref:hypothetical protein n=1 Tax=Streptomyces sp. NPDC046881 TaxID=3155374 RepID=UPI00340E9DD3
MTINDVSLAHHDGEEAAALLKELCDAYADAYGVGPGEEKTGAFRRRAEKQFTRPGFALVTARDGGRLVGFVFGYTLPAGDMHWWGGVQPEPTAEFLEETVSRTWVLSEIEVRLAWQARGVGRALRASTRERRSPSRRGTLVTPGNRSAGRSRLPRAGLNYPMDRGRHHSLCQLRAEHAHRRQGWVRARDGEYLPHYGQPVVTKVITRELRDPAAGQIVEVTVEDRTVPDWRAEVRYPERQHREHHHRRPPA